MLLYNRGETETGNDLPLSPFHPLKLPPISALAKAILFHE